MARKKKRSALISFVGSNDAGKMRGKSDGAILSAIKANIYDEVHLLWNDGMSGDLSFQEIAEYVRRQIERIFKITDVHLHRLSIPDVTDHNEIYPRLLETCREIYKDSNKYTAAIASGTPAMQVCWILLAESGDFPVELIRSNEPQYGKPLVTPVKLGTGLPRILYLQEEKKQLEESKLALIPNLVVDIKNGLIRIGKSPVNLSPVEFCYYRYFVERRIQTEEFVRISVTCPPQSGPFRKLVFSENGL